MAACGAGPVRIRDQEGAAVMVRGRRPGGENRVEAQEGGGALQDRVSEMGADGPRCERGRWKMTAGLVAQRVDLP